VFTSVADKLRLFRRVVAARGSATTRKVAQSAPREPAHLHRVFRIPRCIYRRAPTPSPAATRSSSATDAAAVVKTVFPREGGRDSLAGCETSRRINTIRLTLRVKRSPAGDFEDTALSDVIFYSCLLSPRRMHYRLLRTRFVSSAIEAFDPH